MAQSAATRVTVGVDTHGDLHVAAALDQLGRHLDTVSIPTTPAGYHSLLTWSRGLGPVEAFGIEGTGSYGAELTRHLRQAGQVVLEVNRPDRQARRRGKSDPVDALAAARAVQSGDAAVVPKAQDGMVEMLRALRVARQTAVKARTQAINAIKALLVTAPADLREQLRERSVTELVHTAAGFDPGRLTCPAAATRMALRLLAERHQVLTAEINQLTKQLKRLTAKAAPDLVALNGVGPDSAAALLIAAGDNPERLRSDAAFSMLCGASPIEASSGKTVRHRLNRGGDRQANAALYRIVLSRLRYDQQTQHYVARRTAEGLSKKEIIRCLKRYVAREVFAVLTQTSRPHHPAAA
jgi:transposase